MKIKIQEHTPNRIGTMVMNILDILKSVGVPFDKETDLRKQRMAQACMAIGGIKKSFKEVKSVKDGTFLRTRDIIKFENEHYGENISSSSYDDIRRKDLKLLVLSNIAINTVAIGKVIAKHLIKRLLLFIMLEYGIEFEKVLIAKKV